MASVCHSPPAGPTASLIWAEPGIEQANNFRSRQSAPLPTHSPEVLQNNPLNGQHVVSKTADPIQDLVASIASPEILPSSCKIVFAVVLVQQQGHAGLSEQTLKFTRLVST